MKHVITVLPSGRSFEAHSDETVLEAAIRQHISLPYGCKDGACQSCQCQLIKGKAQHRLSASWLEEQSSILTCQTQAHSDLTIDCPQVMEAHEFAVRKMPSRVHLIEKCSPDVVRLVLELPSNENFDFYPGQYLDILLRDGSRRSYSMAHVPARLGGSGHQIELHIRHMPGGSFTDHVFQALSEKEILRIEGPFGRFRLQASERPIVMIASGTGFAPIKSLLQELAYTGSQRRVYIYWGGRHAVDLYAHQWLLDYAKQHTNSTYIAVLSEADAQDQWQGRTGLVHEAVMHDFSDLRDYEVYACGSPLMVKAAYEAFVAHRHLPASEFFADAFLTRADTASNAS